MSRVFFNRNCPNSVCYNSRVLVCLVITTSTTKSTVKIIEFNQTCLDSQLCSMLANDEDDLEEATATRIFDTVRKFCVAVINNMIQIFPFHDDVYVEGPCCTQSRPCASRVPELIICSRIWLFALVSWQMNIMTHSSLSFRTTSWFLTMNYHSTLLTVVSTHSGQRWQRRNLLVECAFQI